MVRELSRFLRLKWTPKAKLKAGETYLWRVWAKEGEWQGPVVTSSFVVKGEK